MTRVAQNDERCRICDQQVLAGADLVEAVDGEWVHEECARDEEAAWLGRAIGVAVGLLIGC